MGTSLVRSTADDGVAVLVRDNPPLNVTTLELVRDLHAELTRLVADDRVRVLILAAAGRAFGAGSDIKEFDELIAAGDVVERKMAFENETFSMLADFRCPTIAALAGDAYGGGLELALCCDLVIAEAGAKVGFPEVKLGVLPGSGGAARAVRRIGQTRVNEMILFGDPVAADTACAWGLINAVVEQGKALAVARQWAARLAAGSPVGLEACKRAIRDAVNAPVEVAIAQSLELTRQTYAAADVREGIRAFFAKEQPRFG
jgi:enoyl-CoA hydratase